MSILGLGKAKRFLDWINGYYIRQMKLDELTKKCQPYLKQKVNFAYLKKIVALEQPRLKKLGEIGDLADYFFKDKINYRVELLVWKKMSLKQVKANLDKLEKILSKISARQFNQENLEKVLMPLAEKEGDRGELLWPLRVALTGRQASPGPFEVAEILGKKKTLARIKQARGRLNKIL